MRRYLVTIHYREPTYEQRTGRSPVPYRGSYEVEARDENTARALALQAFRRIAAVSSSGWVRMVVDVQCRPLAAGVEVCEVISGD